jgi:hypothetical protein
MFALSFVNIGARKEESGAQTVAMTDCQANQRARSANISSISPLGRPSRSAMS